MAALFTMPLRAVDLDAPVSSTNLLAPGPVQATTEIRLTDWETISLTTLGDGRQELVARARAGSAVNAHFVSAKFTHTAAPPPPPSRHPAPSHGKPPAISSALTLPGSPGFPAATVTVRSGVLAGNADISPFDQTPDDYGPVRQHFFTPFRPDRTCHAGVNLPRK